MRTCSFMTNYRLKSKDGRFITRETAAYMSGDTYIKGRDAGFGHVLRKAPEVPTEERRKHIICRVIDDITGGESFLVGNDMIEFNLPVEKKYKNKLKFRLWSQYWSPLRDGQLVVIESRKEDTEWREEGKLHPYINDVCWVEMEWGKTFYQIRIIKKEQVNGI